MRFLDNPLIKEFIKNREINKKDYALLEKLSGFPIDLIVEELHNQFNLSHEKSGNELKLRIKQMEKLLSQTGNRSESLDRHRFERTKELCEAVLPFFEEYGWGKSYSLVRTLEETANKQSMSHEFFSKFQGH